MFTFSLFGQVQIGKDINGERLWDNCGSSVSISDDGSIMAVGSPYGEVPHIDARLPRSAGHVRVYRREPPAPSNGYVGWVQIGRNISGDDHNDKFGHSVSLSGDGSTVAIGAPENNGNGSAAGHVRVYRREPPAPSNGYVGWVQIGRNIDGDANDYSGCSVSLSSDGSTVAIAARGLRQGGKLEGYVRVYKNIGGTWTQEGSDIDAVIGLGHSVSLSSDGSTVAIGTLVPVHQYSEGDVRVYKNISGTWTQEGSDIDVEALSASGGWSVSLSSDGSTVAIGSPYDGYSDTGNYNIGYVSIYENISGNWTQVGSDIAGEYVVGGWCGHSVSLSADGSVVAIGAPKNIGNYVTNSPAGSARIYKNTSGTWTQVGKDIDGTELGGDFGGSVSLSGDGSTVVIGDVSGKSRRGYAEVYSTGINNAGVTEIKSEFTIYPNPASDELNIKIESNLLGSQFRIINTLGQEVKQGELSNLNSTIDLSKLPKGSYNMLIGTENYSHPFLVE